MGVLGVHSLIVLRFFAVSMIDGKPLLISLLALDDLPQLDLQLMIILIPPMRLKQPNHLLLALLDLPPNHQLIIAGNLYFSQHRTQATV